MKTLIIIPLVLVFLAESTHSGARHEQNTYEEEENKIQVAHMMTTIEAKLKDIRHYCKQDSYRDSRILQKIAYKLESSLSNDQISLLSSKGGMIGSMMMAASFIPSPFSVPLFYYGSYMTAASTVGHVGNVAFKFLKEEIDKEELHSVLVRVEELHAKIQIYEVTREGLNKFPEGAKLLIEKGYVTFGRAESEVLLNKLRYIDTMASSILEREEMSLWELADLCQNIYDVWDFFNDLEWNRETYDRLKAGIHKLVKGSKYAVKEFTQHTTGSGVSEVKSALSGTLHGFGSKWSSIASGITIVWNIYNEAGNIQSTEEHMRDKEAMIWELRVIAMNVIDLCRESDFCE